MFLRLKLIFNNPYILLLICTACWGGNAVAARFAVGEVSPLLLTFLRWVGVSIIICIIAYPTIVRNASLLKARWVYLFCMGALGFTGFNVLFYDLRFWGLHRKFFYLQSALRLYWSLIDFPALHLDQF